MMDQRAIVQLLRLRYREGRTTLGQLDTLLALSRITPAEHAWIVED